MSKINPKNINMKRYVILLGSAAVVCGVFVTRLVDWQIINTEEYKVRANSSNIYFVKTDPVRGEILDRDGVGLAVNDMGYKIVLDRLLIEKGTENDLILKVVRLLEALDNEWIDILPIGIDKNGFYFTQGHESQILSLKKTLNLGENASAEECIKKMCERYKIGDYSDADRRVV